MVDRRDSAYNAGIILRDAGEVGQMPDSNRVFGSVDKITLIVVEEQEIYRKLYEAICPSASPIELRESFPYSAKKTLDSIVARTAPDVILIGVNHLSAELLNEVTQLQNDSGNLGVVLIASSLTSGVIPILNKFVASRKARFGFLFRKSLTHTDQFRTMISSVQAGQIVIDPALGALMDKDNEDVTSISGLTPREIEVLNLIARGRTNEAISVSLFIDVKTVRHHINNIYGKLKTNSTFDDRHPRVSATNAYHQLTGQLIFEDLG